MKKRIQKLGATVLALLLLCWIPVFALASVPSRPESKYVLDSAGVLSQETEERIISGNKELFESTGGEIVIVAVDFLNGQEIDDYAYDLFSLWGIGSRERNNGLLLVMSIAQEDYYALPGYGIEDELDGGRLQQMLDDYVEPDFAVGDYDASAREFFEAAYEAMSNLRYNDEYDQDQSFQQGGAYENYGSYDYDSGSSGVGALGLLIRFAIRVILIVVVVVLVINLLRAITRGGGGGTGSGGSGGFWRGMLLGNMLGSRRRRYYTPPPVSPPRPGGRSGYGQARPPRNTGGFGGSSGFGGFSGGSRGGFSSGGSSRSGFSGGSRSGGSRGGFSGGGGSRGGGAGRR